MDVSLFDYHLPPERIGQQPARRRDASRLLVMARDGGDPSHRIFADLPRLLLPGDLIVVNDARVRSARLHGAKPTGGRVELLALAPVAPPEADGAEVWRCLVKASRRPGLGSAIDLPGGWHARLLREGERGEARVRFQPGGDTGPATVVDLLESHGEMPLPPYIRCAPGDERADLDRHRYQTIFAAATGAVAAPTAGLHFTPELVERLRAREVRVATLTLLVGPGTFRPVRAARVEQHRLDVEHYALPAATAEAISRTRAAGGRVVACGTTVVRALETVAAARGRVEPDVGESGLFIYPGFRFRVVDALLTNFHLPRSTLLMLVCAFAGREAVLSAYRQAVRREYRFYSYGDAMLILPGEGS